MCIRLSLVFLAAILFWSSLSRAQFKVTPNVLDFGAVKTDTAVDSFFVIDALTTVVKLNDSLNYQSFVKDTESFHVDSVKGIQGVYTLDHSFIRINVHFSPHANKTYREQIRIHNDQDFPATVTLLGVGIAPQIASNNIDFGKLRVGDSAIDTIAIRNISPLTTTVDSVNVVNALWYDSISTTYSKRDSIFGNDTIHLIDTIHSDHPVLRGYSDTTEFHLLDTLVFPQKPMPIAFDGDSVVRIVERDSIWRVPDPNGLLHDTLLVLRDTIRSIHDTVRYIPVLFSPRSIGTKILVLKIHTSFGQTLYDTVWGFGAEPLLTVTPALTNFGNIDVSATTPPMILDSFIVENRGTWPAKIAGAFHQDSNFALTPLGPTSLGAGEQIMIYDTFKITQEGDFSDTVRLTNDTRYWLYGDTTSTDSMTVLRASVRLPSLKESAQHFDDTVRNCDLQEGTLTIHNPYPITARIDSIYFDSTSAGLSFLDSLLQFPIFIPSDSSFTFLLGYRFPNDSLNGTQQMTVHLVNHHKDGDSVGTAIMLAYRHRPELTLHAHLPSYASSANDITLLDLPITVEGPRQGVRELDAWTLTLTFSNDLFLPIELDTSGGLVTKHDSTPFALSYSWDDSRRTFTITTSGAKLSDTLSRFNDLLFKIKMRAFLTPDTEVTVTPVLKFVQYPCAYTLHPFTLAIPYADDCGDIILRTFMRSDSIPLRISPLSPNPVQAVSPVTLSMNAAADMTVHISTFDAAGRTLGRTEATIGRGPNILKIGSDLLPRSGLAEILVEGFSSDGSLISRQVMKLAIQN